MISLSGLDVRADGVLLLNGIPIESRNTIWNGQPAACVAACLDPKYGLVWRVDHATGDLAAKISALGATDQRLETMWSLTMGRDGEDPRRAGPER